MTVTGSHTIDTTRLPELPLHGRYLSSRAVLGKCLSYHESLTSSLADCIGTCWPSYEASDAGHETACLLKGCWWDEDAWRYSALWLLLTYWLTIFSFYLIGLLLQGCSGWGQIHKRGSFRIMGQVYFSPESPWRVYWEAGGCIEWAFNTYEWRQITKASSRMAAGRISYRNWENTADREVLLQTSWGRWHSAGKTWQQLSWWQAEMQSACGPMRDRDESVRMIPCQQTVSHSEIEALRAVAYLWSEKWGYHPRGVLIKWGSVPHSKKWGSRPLPPLKLRLSWLRGTVLVLCRR